MGEFRGNRGDGTRPERERGRARKASNIGDDKPVEILFDRKKNARIDFRPEIQCCIVFARASETIARYYGDSGEITKFVHNIQNLNFMMY